MQLIDLARNSWYFLSVFLVLQPFSLFNLSVFKTLVCPHVLGFNAGLCQNMSRKISRYAVLLGVLFLPYLAFSQITATGLNDHGQTTVPSAALNGVKVVAGREFSLALMADGTVVGWGYSADGRTNAPAGLSGVVAVSAGIYHTLALKNDGTVVGWGFNGNDILSIPANLTDVLAIAAGGYHSLAVKRDGTVIGWGYPGDGRTTPPPTLTDVIAIAAGRDHSVALKSDGKVVAFGLNDNRQTNVPAGLTGVIAITAGENHTLALKADGTVVAWGLNTSGQTNVPTGLTGVVAVAAGAQHSLALKGDGTVVSWGSNANGQRNITGSNIRAIAAGGYHSLVVRGTGPLITQQPLSQTVLAGSPVTFTVGATGSGLNYQWQFEGADIADATASVLHFDDAVRANAGVYTVKVANGAGTTTSANAVLIVRGLQQLTAPQILTGGKLRLVFGDQHGDAISAPNAGRYEVQISADLQTWSLLNLPLTLVNGQLQVDDPDAQNHPQRFYRVVEK